MRSSSHLLTFLALAAAVAILPELAAACAVCGGGDDIRVKDSYVDATIFMSVLPLAVIGGGVYTLRRRFRARDAEYPQPASRRP